MKTVIVDYSKNYFQNVIGTDVPDKYSGKFVQIRHEETEYLLLSPKDFTKYHADIVEKFCLEQGLSGSYNSAKKAYEIYDPSWSIIGGGKFELDSTKKFIRLYDDSMAYGRFNPEGLEEKIMHTEDFKGYSVKIE
ncbi:MAG: hypothetical protein N2511_07815 [Thermodesulfovibrionales bacterium]|nr:hypothetical protein [Thermodesulfovibrionales bacterium]